MSTTTESTEAATAAAAQATGNNDTNDTPSGEQSSSTTADSTSAPPVPDVEVLSEAKIVTIPFAVSLPKAALQGFDDSIDDDDLSSTKRKKKSVPKTVDEAGGEEDTSAIPLIGMNGIVGSIVLMGNSAMVWVGWGTLDLYSTNASTNIKLPDTNTSGFGKGIPPMGQLVVAMPRTNYKGAFGTNDREASCSQLIGSESSDDNMLATQMASRLSTRSGMPIFVSCQLASGSRSASNSLQGWTAGLDAETLSHRAAALAEKEIWKLIQEKLDERKEMNSTKAN